MKPEKQFSYMYRHSYEPTLDDNVASKLDNPIWSGDSLVEWTVNARITHPSGEWPENGMDLKAVEAQLVSDLGNETKHP